MAKGHLELMDTGKQHTQQCGVAVTRYPSSIQTAAIGTALAAGTPPTTRWEGELTGAQGVNPDKELPVLL